MLSQELTKMKREKERLSMRADAKGQLRESDCIVGFSYKG